MTKKRAQQLFRDYPELVTARVYVTKFPKWAYKSSLDDCTHGEPFGPSLRKTVWFHKRSLAEVKKSRVIS